MQSFVNNVVQREPCNIIIVLPMFRGRPRAVSSIRARGYGPLPLFRVETANRRKTRSAGGKENRENVVDRKLSGGETTATRENAHTGRAIARAYVSHRSTRTRYARSGGRFTGNEPSGGNTERRYRFSGSRRRVRNTRARASDPQINRVHDSPWDYVAKASVHCAPRTI